MSRLSGNGSRAWDLWAILEERDLARLMEQSGRCICTIFWCSALFGAYLVHGTAVLTVQCYMDV